MSSIDECMYSHIRMWIVSLLESGCLNRTVNRKIASLKSYYKYLLVIGRIDVSPLLKHKSLKIDTKIQIPFSLKEVRGVLVDIVFDDSFEGVRDNLIIEMFYATGIRKAELIGIKISDLDLKLKAVKVLGKRNKERFIPLSDVLVKKLESYLLLRGVDFDLVDIDYLFLTKRGFKIYDSLVYRVINSYFSFVSTKLKKSPHVLRHTFATHLIDSGADLNSVKELLGHSSIAATQIYVHNSMAKLKDVYGSSHPRNIKK
jgi:integrase/recombinase XerC